MVPAAIFTRSQSDRTDLSKIKHWMRMAQKRTIEETWRHVGALLGTIAAKEGAGYFKNAGYQYVKN